MILDNINKRTMGAAVVWIISTTAVAIHVLTFGIIGIALSKLIYSYACFGCLAYVVWQLLKGFDNNNHKAFIILTIASLSVFFLFLILYWQFGIDDYKWKIGVFLLTELLTISCIVTSGLKQGLFNHAKDML